ncbi:WXG100 family type VII secretion target [Kitasatospora aureofaciens]|uniref:WXG100 family type VII secretion target n=1 Tax=Kitasatospora aureofaciens TaxID=1894 RepID=UPI003827ED44
MTGGTNFSGFDHAKLKSMVDNTDPATVLSRGTALQSAGRVLADLSQALGGHAANLAWEGPAAEGFKTWVGNLQQTAASLGDYSHKAGDAMHQAGEALSLAKAAMPEVPTCDISTVTARASQPCPTKAAYDIANMKSPNPTTAMVDAAMKGYDKKWVSEAEALAAAQRVYKAHQEAVHQMENLGQAYDAATKQLNGLPIVATAGTQDPSIERDGTSDYSKGGGSSGGYGGTVRAPRASGNGGGSRYSATGGSYSGGSVALRQPASGPQGPDSLGQVDPISSRGGGYVPLPQEQGASTPSSVPSIPIDRPGTGLDSLPTVPTLPSQNGSVGPLNGGSVPFDGLGGVPGRSGGPGEGGGNPAFPIGGPVPVGGSPGKGGSVPARSGGSIPGKSGGSVPGRPAPFGGGSLPGKTGTPGLPTGNVFGSREAQPGRAGASGMPGMGGMHPGVGGHGAGGSGGGTRGRGLASTGGGIVGGRKGPSTSGEFTPGGTGLRRRAGAVEGSARSGQNGMMAPGMHGGGTGRSERDRRQRAGYLHEDEETWTSGTPQSNPNVIE